MGVCVWWIRIIASHINLMSISFVLTSLNKTAMSSTTTMYHVYIRRVCFIHMHCTVNIVNTYKGL